MSKVVTGARFAGVRRVSVQLLWRARAPDLFAQSHDCGLFLSLALGGWLFISRACAQLLDQSGLLN